MVTELLCVGGPLDSHTIQVADAAHLPAELVLPYWPTPDGAADRVWYIPVRVMLFNRRIWVLVHAPVRADGPVMQHMLALKLLSPEAFKRWEHGTPKPKPSDPEGITR